MYILKVYDNDKKEVILEVRTNSLKWIFDNLVKYCSKRYQVLIKTEGE